MIILWAKLKSRVRVQADVLNIFCIIALVISLSLFGFTCATAITINEIHIFGTLKAAAYISCFSCLVMIIWLPFYKVLHCIKKLIYWILIVFMIITFLALILAITGAIMAKDFTDEDFVKKNYLNELQNNIMNKDVSTWVKFDSDNKCCNWDGALDIVGLGQESLTQIDNNINKPEFLKTLGKCFEEFDDDNSGNFSLHKGNDKYSAELNNHEISSIHGCHEKIMEDVNYTFTGIICVAFVVSTISLVLIVTILFYLYQALIRTGDRVVLIEDKDNVTVNSAFFTAAEELQAEAGLLKEGRHQSLRTPVPPKKVNFK